MAQDRPKTERRPIDDRTIRNLVIENSWLLLQQQRFQDHLVSKQLNVMELYHEQHD